MNHQDIVTRLDAIRTERNRLITERGKELDAEHAALEVECGKLGHVFGACGRTRWCVVCRHIEELRP